MYFLLALVLTGTFALPGTPSTQGHLVATQLGPSPLRQRLDFWLTRAPSVTVDRYDVDMTKRLHLIVIGDDFTTFMHVHPALGSDHHFHIDVQFPKAELYHVYADAEPSGLGRAVFRFDVAAGPQHAVARNLAPTGSSVRAGDYTVALATTHVRAGRESELAVHITKGGKPASDLFPYLGALAHAVFIDASTLSYAHVHPMAMSDMSGMAGMPGMNAAPLSDGKPSSPNMMLHVAVPQAGTYKLWLQFRATDGLHVAPFVITAN